MHLTFSREPLQKPQSRVGLVSIVLVLGVWLAGCVKYTFWLPSADTGRNVGLHCRGGPPPGTIEFNNGGVRISLLILDGLRVQVIVPKGEKLSLDVNAVRFRTAKEDGYLLPVAMQGVIRGEPPVMLPHTNPMVLVGTTYYGYVLDFSMPPDVADQFVINMPPLLHGQETMRLPPVTFTRTTSSYSMVINC